MRKLNIYQILGSFLFIATLPAYAIDIAEGCVQHQHATDKNVFNWRYYLNINADLAIAGLQTPEEACNHWLINGIREGRQAHAGFHSIQYLNRHTDLLEAYGNDYAESIVHFVNHGNKEGRMGYQENGILLGQLTTTISSLAQDGKIFIGTSQRNAGAIDSLIFDNVEFINATDHGRELQIAYSSNYGGRYNPTEAGSCADDLGYSTSAILRSISASDGNMSTTNNPAFWFKPGNDKNCGGGVNSNVTANNHIINKSISIGIPKYPNAVNFTGQIQVNEVPHQDPLDATGPKLLFELPTGYMAGEFNRVYQYNLSNSVIKEITNSSCMILGCWTNDPLIYATKDLSHAMAVCSVNASGASFTNIPAKYIAWGPLGSTVPFHATTKWSVIRLINDNITSGTEINFSTLLLVAKSSDNTNAVDKLKNDLSNLQRDGYCI